MTIGRTCTSDMLKELFFILGICICCFLDRKEIPDRIRQPLEWDYMPDNKYMYISHRNKREICLARSCLVGYILYTRLSSRVRLERRCHQVCQPRSWRVLRRFRCRIRRRSLKTLFDPGWAYHHFRFSGLSWRDFRNRLSRGC
jgi:hypothetical protein